MSKNPLLTQCICLISPYRRWIDLFCQTFTSQTQLQHRTIENDQQLTEHLLLQSNGDLFGHQSFYHLHFKQFATLKQALSIRSQHIFSIDSATKLQIQTLAATSITIKIMQYPKRSDLQTIIHQFAQQKNMTTSLNHLLEGHDDHIDHILEACEREHLLSLNPSPTSDKNQVHSTSSRGFDICKLIYQFNTKQIATLIHELDVNEMMSAYWLICKHLHIHHQTPSLSGSDLIKLTPFKPIHSSIEQWHKQHKKKLAQYLQLAFKFENKLKGGIGSDLKIILLELALKMGQRND